MKWGKRFNEMTPEELRIAHAHHIQAFKDANELAAIAGATFPQTFCQQAARAEFNLARCKLIQNVARKASISLT